jgi:uncharacterized repeat protein (TIGR03803 family)
LALLATLLVLGAAGAFVSVGTQPLKETILHRFAGIPDGMNPEAGLLVDMVGNLDGTTVEGGAHRRCFGGYGNGCGTVFSIDASGHERVVYSFRGRPDGSSPFAGLIADGAGNLYGTTAAGGTTKACYTDGGDGCGTVFRIDAAGHESLVYSFKGNAAGQGDGQGPEGVVVADAAGDLYGTTPFGGTNFDGTIFKIDPTGHETVLYSFTGGGDGARPYSGVILDAAGNLYGTAYFGGNSGCVSGCGTVFKLDPSGALTVLHAFTGTTDGGNPYAPLVADRRGNLYGTTELYGNNSCGGGNGPGCGVVFELDGKRKETMLHTFAGSPDGRNPYTALVRDANGNLYGTTAFGGDQACNGGYSCGVVYEVRATGAESILHTFTGGKRDGEVAYGGVVLDATGKLYGTTVSGGIGACNRGCGVVFALTP